MEFHNRLDTLQTFSIVYLLFGSVFIPIKIPSMLFRLGLGKVDLPRAKYVVDKGIEVGSFGRRLTPFPQR